MIRVTRILRHKVFLSALFVFLILAIGTVSIGSAWQALDNFTALTGQKFSQRVLATQYTLRNLYENMLNFEGARLVNRGSYQFKWAYGASFGTADNEQYCQAG